MSDRKLREVRKVLRYGVRRSKTVSDFRKRHSKSGTDPVEVIEQMLWDGARLVRVAESFGLSRGRLTQLFGEFFVSVEPPGAFSFREYKKRRDEYIQERGPVGTELLRIGDKRFERKLRKKYPVFYQRFDANKGGTSDE